MSIARTIRRAHYRAGQFFDALSPRVPARDRALAAAALSPAQLAAFHRMAATDQRHAARVLRLVLVEGARDPDLVVAALLHDLGKVDAGGAGRVRLPHRVAKVLLERAWPAAWRRLSARPRPGPALGCYLLRHHPALGASWAARLGCSPRARALIAAHQDGRLRSAECGVRTDESTRGPVTDMEGLEEALRQLRRADERS